MQVGQVHDVVPELRAACLVELGHDEGAELAVGEGLAGIDVDDLDDERVLLDVQALASGALGRDPLHFVEAVGLVVRGAEGLLEQRPVADIRQRTELEIVLRVDAHLPRLLGEAKQVVTGREDRLRAVLDGELDLALAARDGSGSGRQHDAVEPVVERLVHGEGAVMRGVGPGVQDGVARSDALHVERSGGEDRAGLPVPGRVERRARVAGRAAGHEDTHRLPRRVLGPHALVVAEGRVGLDALADVVDRIEGDAVEVGEGLDRSRIEVRCVPASLEEGHAIGAHSAILHPRELLRLDLLAGVEPGRLEVLRRRRIHPGQRVVVDRLVRTSDSLGHAALFSGRATCRRCGGSHPCVASRNHARQVIAPRSLSFPISSQSRPSSWRISSVCWPASGAGAGWFGAPPN